MIERKRNLHCKSLYEVLLESLHLMDQYKELDLLNDIAYETSERNVRELQHHLYNNQELFNEKKNKTFDHSNEIDLLNGSRPDIVVVGVVTIDVV